MKKILTALVCALSLSAAIAQNANPKPYSVRMAESEMIRNPKAWLIEGKGKTTGNWNYTPGLEVLSIWNVYDRYRDPAILAYALGYAENMVRDDGTIVNYRPEIHNIDHITPGRVVMKAYQLTGEKRYRKALDALRAQLEEQPRTSEGGFWHKDIYPWQMWLDGLYMGSPFYGEYTRAFTPADQKAAKYQDIVNQFLIVAKHTYDPSCKLYRHAWDEKRAQPWADKTTGQSQHVWGRALGWYCIAIVDALDNIPDGTPGREDVIKIFQGIYDQLPKYQDKKSGMWYQVLDMPDREGNYEEATCSAMFVYAMLKGIRKHYLGKERLPEALRNYENFVKRFVTENPDGTINVIQCCAVAGLGGSGNRSGTYEYYLSEPIRDNDCKGVGPFMWASLEYEAAKNVDYLAPGTLEAGGRVAFPGAEGGGMYTTGGRGGKVLYVTSLKDDGSEGTLRWAVDQKGPRTVMFKVSGTIALTKALKITSGDLTIAGQSAPGDGICVRDYPVTLQADNIIVRYLRFRLGDVNQTQHDAFGGVRVRNILVDHCSMSWSTDEVGSFYGIHNLTVQWCILSESLCYSSHAKGKHGYGGIWGGRNATFHHNLLACNTSRNPRFDHTYIYPADYLVTHRGSVDYVNNVVYNWGYKANYGGEEGWWNFVGNYYKPGPASTTKPGKIIEVSYESSYMKVNGHYYIRDNFVEGSPDVNADNWKGVELKGEATRQDAEATQPYKMFCSLAVESPKKAYESVLAGAGASIFRDAVDTRVVDNVRKGTVSYRGSKGGAGIIDSQNDVGGWPVLKSKAAPADTDGDGMPDEWEKRNGLNPADPADGAAYKLSKEYTNLEMYLNSLVK